MPVPIIGIHLQLDYIVAWQVLQVLFLAVVVDAQDAEGKDAVFGDQLGWGGLGVGWGQGLEGWVQGAVVFLLEVGS